MKMSGKDVVHLLIVLGVGGYVFYGSITETGFGGWMNHAQFAILGTYSVEISFLIASGLVSVLILLSEIVWNIVSGSRGVFEQSMGYRLLFGASATAATPPAVQGRGILQTAADEWKSMGDNRRLPKASDFPPGTKFVINEFDVPLAFVPGKGWFNWSGGVPRAYDPSFLKQGNHWDADSFEQWVGIVEASRKRT